MKKAIYPGIPEVTRETIGGFQKVHLMPCSCSSCQNAVEVVVGGKRKPQQVLHNIAKRRGWTVRKDTFTCPEHAQ